MGVRMANSEIEVVDAEVLDDTDDHLPAIVDTTPAARPIVTQHTILAPGESFTTEQGGPRYTEADFRISERTQQRREQSPPENTARNYRTARDRFKAWCAEQGRVPLPCTTATFLEYVNHLIDLDHSPSHIQVAMSAIRTMHPDGQKPGTQDARQAVNAHAKKYRSRKSRRKAQGVKSDDLARIVATCDQDTADGRPLAGTRDAALLTVGWGMLARRSELANLLVDNVTVDDEGVTVHIAYSKTDQEAKGVDTFVPANPDDPTVCPVVRMRAWLEELRALGVAEGALFRQITRGDRLALRVGVPRGESLSADAVGAIIKRRARRADPKMYARVTAHGLRRGPAQEMADEGIDPTGQGRWKDGSTTVQEHYVTPARGRKNNPIVAMRAAKKAAEQQNGANT